MISIRTRRALAAASTALLLAPGAALAAPDVAAAAVTAANATQTIDYLSHSFTVPAAWPSVKLTATSTACLRFDVHAVYLGAPSAIQQCPDKVLGRTDALEIQPAAAGAAAQASQDSTSHQISVTAAGVTVTASYGSSPAQIDAILASAGLPVPSAGSSAAGAAETQSAVPIAPAAVHPTTASAPSSATTYTGEAFDPCAAPSSSAMSAWKSASPYAGIGVYIGGVNMGCAQPNLTASWVSAEASAGWHFFPLYVGVQDPYVDSCTNCELMSSPASDGTAAAQDAAAQAAALGFGPGTPIVYDMEAYSNPAGTSDALTFISAWTVELHALGYESGEYSSESSGISDLIANMSSYTMPDVIDFANWNGAASTADSGIPGGDWANHQRIHQYSGGVDQTYGGYTINVDQDYMDVVSGAAPASTAPSGTHQASEAVAQNSGTVDLLYKGTDGTLQHAWYNPGSTWNPAMSLGGAMASEPSTVTSNAGHVEAFWQGTDGTLWHAYTNGGDWTAPVSLGYALGGAPRAVAQANGDLDAFWVGADGGLWYAQYTVGGNWPATATELAPAGSVATGTLPAPVVSAAGTTDVFYKGTDDSLYHVWSNNYGSSWNSPVDLAMGPLGSGPAATGHVNGDVNVFWVGADDGIWSAQYSIGGTWPSVPSELAPAGSAAAGVLPAPVTSADPTTDVFYQGTDGTLYHVWSNNYGSTWNAPQNLGTGTITQPFVAGQSNGTIDVFWKDPSAANIWHTWYQPANGWTANPASMGGNAA